MSCYAVIHPIGGKVKLFLTSRNDETPSSLCHENYPNIYANVNKKIFENCVIFQNLHDFDYTNVSQVVFPPTCAVFSWIPGAGSERAAVRLGRLLAHGQGGRQGQARMRSGWRESERGGAVLAEGKLATAGEARRSSSFPAGRAAAG